MGIEQVQQAIDILLGSPSLSRDDLRALLTLKRGAEKEDDTYRDFFVFSDELRRVLDGLFSKAKDNNPHVAQAAAIVIDSLWKNLSGLQQSRTTPSWARSGLSAYDYLALHPVSTSDRRFMRPVASDGRIGIERHFHEFFKAYPGCNVQWNDERLTLILDEEAIIYLRANEDRFFSPLWQMNRVPQILPASINEIIIQERAGAGFLRRCLWQRTDGGFFREIHDVPSVLGIDDWRLNLYQVFNFGERPVQMEVKDGILYLQEYPHPFSLDQACIPKKLRGMTQSRSLSE